MHEAKQWKPGYLMSTDEIDEMYREALKEGGKLRIDYWKAKRKQALQRKSYGIIALIAVSVVVGYVIALL